MLFEKIQLEQDEEVLRTVRKHWFVIAAELFGTFIMILLPFVVLFFITIFPGLLLNLGLHPEHHVPVIIFFTAAWLLLTLMSAFRIWTHYYLDLWLITDRRIIVVDQIHFFNRKVSVFRLERMQDIEYKVSGLIPTMFNFGTLDAQTAGAGEDNFHSTGLPDPRGLQALIQKAMDQRLRDLNTNTAVAADGH